MPKLTPPERRCWRPAEWPPADLAAWRRALKPAHPLDKVGGEAAHLRPSTVRLYENAYGRWLCWLYHNGGIDPHCGAGARADASTVKAYYDDLRGVGLADYTIANFLGGLAAVLKAIEPGEDFDWIRRAAGNVFRSAKPARNIEERLRPPEDLLRLGEALIMEAERDAFRSPQDRAILARDGLIISLLVCCPLRVQNLGKIALNKHLVRENEGWLLRFEATEMKNGRPFEVPWPDSLAEPLEDYLVNHRPVLAKRQSIDALWVSSHTKPMTVGDVAYRVVVRTRTAFGVATNPHAFRHIAATAVATEDPAGVAGIAGLLGHATTKTSEGHYNKAKAIDSGHRYQKAVETLRAGAAKRLGPKHRRKVDDDLY